MTTMEKLTILTDAAKYDAACTSSGSDRGGLHHRGRVLPHLLRRRPVRHAAQGAHDQCVRL